MNALGSYHTPYYSTPGQPRVAPGVGALGAYNAPSYPGRPGMGMEPGGLVVYYLASVLFNAGAGYLVGKQVGEPAILAVASGIFGLPGMFFGTLYAVRKGA